MSEQTTSTGVVVSTDDVFRILVATDNHLGYAEKDALRGNDSFIAFEEIMQMAVEQQVDFILLGGDLFHEATPSPNAYQRCVQALRVYTFGEKPVEFELLSDQQVNFQSAINNAANYEDPNLNIAIPVFSIHGNHDDPSGYGRLSTLDLLSTSGLVNYFGRWTDPNRVDIKPLLMRKGETYLALYGLSHIQDVRLGRLFDLCQVSVEKPAAEEGDFFNLMVLHQNRAERGRKNFVPESSLPDFMDLIVWGHEHDCRIEPELNGVKDFYVSQPGSSVATSLCEGEAGRKYVALLEVHKKRFILKPLPLQTVRPFVFDTLRLADMVDEYELDAHDAEEKVWKLAHTRVLEMLEKSKELLTGHEKQPKLPLLRLRIEYNDERQMFNAIRFGQSFGEQVANPAELLKFKRQIKAAKKEGIGFDKDAMAEAMEETHAANASRVEDLLESYFKNSSKNKLKFLPIAALTEMCTQLVQHSDVHAVNTILNHCQQRGLAHLMQTLPDEDEIVNELQSLRDEINHDEIMTVLQGTSRFASNGSNNNDAPSTSAAAAKKNTTARDRVSAKAAAATAFDDESDGSPEKFAQSTSRGRGRGRGRGRATTAAAATAKAAPAALDVTVGNTKRSSRQQTLSSLISNQRKKVPVFELPDSDSD